LAAHISLQRCD